MAAVPDIFPGMHKDTNSLAATKLELPDASLDFKPKTAEERQAELNKILGKEHASYSNANGEEDFASELAKMRGYTPMKE